MTLASLNHPGRSVGWWIASVGLLAATAAGAQPPRLDPQLEEVLNAVRDGEFEPVTVAIEGGMAVDAKAPNGMTALHVRRCSGGSGSWPTSSTRERP